MRRIGVRSFLFVTLSLVSAAPVVWLGTVEASRLGRIAVNEANRRVRELGLDVSRSTGNHVNEQVRTLSTLAAQIEPSMLGNSAYLQRVLDGLFRYTSAYAAVYVGDEYGVAIASAPVLGFDGKPNAGTDYRDRPYFQQLLQNPQVLVSGVDVGRRTNQPALHIVAPVLNADHSSFEAYIAGSVSLESLRQVILSCFEPDSGAQVVLVDENSRIIADSRPNPKPYLTDVSSDPLLRWAGSTEPRIAPDESGHPMRASVVPVLSEYVKWDVIVFRAEAETASAAHTMRLSTLRVSVWALLGALLVSYISSRKYAKPITELVNAAKQGTVAPNGQVLSSAGWSVPQELVELSTAVGQLLSREHEHKASLNELVRARTEELEAANQQLAVLAIALENAGDAICMTDAEGKIEWTNPGFRRITGYFPGESVGTHLAVLLGIKGPFFNFGQRIEEQVPEPAKARKSGLTWRNPVRSRVRDGAELDLDVAISPVTDDKGHPTRYVAVARDVTAQRRAAQEIADSEARYRTLVEHAPEAVVVLDTEAGHFVDCNVRAEELFRRVRQHLLRSDIVGLSPELQPDGRKSAPAIHAQVDAAKHGDSPFFEWTFVDSHGDLIPCEVRLVGLPGKTTKLVRASVVDISERLQREQERRELQKRLDGAERLAGIGAVAAGVAHEINNPLAYILNNLEFVLKKDTHTGLSNAARDALTEAQNGALRVRDVVRDLRTFARVDSDVKAPLDMRTVMDASINIASSDLLHRARIVKDYQDVPPVVADPSRLGQVFLNLIINAIQALPEGSPSEQLIRIVVRPSADGEWVNASVEDSGHGIPEDRLERIFEPFYTTKPIGKGTGLGLSISRNIVISFGGHIEVQSQLGKGSVFTVALPVCSHCVTEPSNSAKPEAPTLTHALAILVLDDDVMVARSIARTLGTQHQVTVCTRGAEALSMLSERSYDVIFCDVMMPEMGGLEFLSRLSAIRPELAERVVFMTGGLFIPDLRERLDQVPNLCIAKPFQPEAVLDAVRRSISQAPEPASANVASS